MRTSRRVARLQQLRQVESSAADAIADLAVGYIRVSTDEQAQHGHGLESQERSIRAFAESQGYELLKIIKDPGVSGAVRPDDRPGFAQLSKLSFRILLVWKFDRLARQIVFAVTAVNELEKRGIVVRSVTEPIDTATPMGRTIFAVLAGMAEQERQAITERTWLGRKEKAIAGGFAGGGTPYGYRRTTDGGLEVEEKEAGVVRRIFALARAGAAHAAIARRLNHEGLRTRRGSVWRQSTIAYMLDNPKYRGAVEYLFKWAGDAHVLREGAHAPIVGGADGGSQRGTRA